MANLLLACIVALCVLKLGQALECYSCYNSYFISDNEVLEYMVMAENDDTGEASCGEKWDASQNIITCEGNDDRCAKVEYQIELDWGGDEGYGQYTIVYRDCYSSEDEGQTADVGCEEEETDFMEDLFAGSGADVDPWGMACGCADDLCNGSPAVMFASVTVMLTTLAAHLM